MTDDPILTQLARANPEPHPLTDASDTQLLARILATPVTAQRPARPAMRILVPALSLAVVIAVVLVIARAGGTHRAATSPGSVGTQQVVVKVEPTPSAPRVTTSGLRHEIVELRERLNALGVGGGSVRQLGDNQIAISYQSVRAPDQAVLRELLSTPQIAFADWEANVIAPDGRAVASQLRGGGRVDERLSQGATAGPGIAGATPLYGAVRLASHQRSQPRTPALSRLGPEYFAFTARGRYLGGPATTRHDLRAPRDAVTLAIPQGTLVIQAQTSQHTVAAEPRYQDSRSRFFVLRDRLNVADAELTRITATERNGAPGLRFDLTAGGRQKLDELTAAIARRGATLSHPGGSLTQHLAIIENGVLLSVAPISAQPDPIAIGTTTALPSDLSPSATRQIAAQLTQSLPAYALEMVSR